ncbi:hypothetical protein [Streptomyces sp. NPDC004267]
MPVRLHAGTAGTPAAPSWPARLRARAASTPAWAFYALHTLYACI